MTDSYQDFLHAIQARFTAALAAGDNLLFQTDAVGLFDAYLANLPADQRQYHNCSCCRAFVKTFGGLVTIDASGRTTPAVWNDLDTADLGTHAQGVAAMHAIVASAQVKGPFLRSLTTWGQLEAGGFTHMHVTPPAAILHQHSSTLTARQRMAERRQQFGTLSRGLADYTLAHLRTAVQVLDANAVYRSARFLGAAQFLEKLKSDVEATPNRVARANIIWKALAGAPDGYCYPRSSVIGTLLDDIVAGLPFDDLRRRFESKTAPDVYQHATATPKAGNVERAEKLFAELGLAPALARRYMRVDEVPAFWRATAEKPVLATGGAMPRSDQVFGHVKARDAATATAGGLEVPAAKMTWAKFRDTILPTAASVEAQVPTSGSRFAALVTAADAKAPNLLQWNNPSSWYYAAGIDGEFRRRVEAAGGQYEDVDVRATLIWNNRNDLDLMARTPRGYHIYFSQKRDGAGGYLDVDRNVGGETTEPVENIRWPRGTAPDGWYHISVWNYNHHERPAQDTPYLLELEVGGQRFTYEGMFGSHDALRVERQVVSFEVRDGKLVGQPSGTAAGGKASGDATTWGLTPGAYVPVLGIAKSPNLWAGDDHKHFGDHTFFLLAGCRDDQQGRGRGFFTETVRGDLREVRQVLEAHLRAAEIEAVDQPACGLGFAADRDWQLTLRVQTPGGMRYVVIDRHD